MLELIYTPEVQAALHENRPVVALETTVITHGLPYPENVETAQAMETAVRESGAVPATIGILNGQIHIGLTDDQRLFLAEQGGDNVRKCSRRDLPLVLARGEHGATTVAGTMILAHMAGIELFATGGIGGVHRGHPFDVSADLTELGRTAVTVVCSGAKSILDLSLTLEVLETHGVPVIGYQTDYLPTFFTPSSAFPVTVRVDTAVETATIINTRRQLNLHSGTLITVPVPAQHALDPAQLEQHIAQATREADAAGISGAATTPWLLSRLVELTAGETLQANIALLKNNGRVAGAIAQALHT
ncbi:MAG: pseudouridine-5'-phosphate glycosidase [Anaerolineales bacterium]|nr:pseudouridine-5'-phosphate glycosidase [Anaerolineales bacterium]